MQSSDILCYIFLTITVAVTCVETDHQMRDERNELRLLKRYNRRVPIVMIENPIDGALQKSKAIYRRVSQSQRFVPQKPKHGVARPRYKRLKPSKFPPGKPGKRQNHRPKFTASKYSPPSNKHKKRNSVPRYGPPPKHRPKPEFTPSIKQAQYFHNAPDNIGFGEPPTNYANDYLPPKQSYGEPPVDSYGVPLKPNTDAPISPTAQSFQENPDIENQNHYNIQSSISPWSQNKDPDFAFSKKYPFYSKPDPDGAIRTPAPEDYNDDFEEIDAPQFKFKDARHFRKKPSYFSDNTIVVNRPWRGHKKPDVSAEIVVGGRYAEPPARYVAKFKPSAPMIDDGEDDVFLPYNAYVHHRLDPSANSPYMNYKHSNIAFSPQNLNDAFGIVK